MDEILKEFKDESLELVQDLITILEEVEDDPSQGKKLEEFGQKVDRIMGSAKTMVMTTDDPSDFELIGDYAELCKVIGYKASQVSNNQSLVSIAAGLLFDAAETLEKIIRSLGEGEVVARQSTLSQPFLERLVWLSQQFDEGLRASLAIEGSEQVSGEKVSADPEEKIENIQDVLNKFFK